MRTRSGSLAPARGGWAVGRFTAAVALLFILQVAIIFLMAERPVGSARRAAVPTVFRALAAGMDQNQIAQRFFAADPIVFASATLHGFSGRAWLRFQPVRYGPAEELEPPSLLALDPRHLGANLPGAEDTNQAPFQLAEGRGPQLEPLPVFPAASSLRLQSVYYVEGPLAGRQLGPQVVLPSWPTNQLLGASVVQFAVNRGGEVVLHRLAGRSGLADADMEAVAVTRRLRFTPLNASAPAITWSKTIFQWQTREPAVK